MIRSLLLIFACISFIVVIGGAVYEHLALVPVWSAAVPASLTVFQGEYALRPQNFWIPVHPVTIVLLVISLIANWSSERRILIAVTLIGYVAVLGLTALYFVPELMELTQTPFSATVDNALTDRANRWEMLSLVRLGILLILAVSLLSALTRRYDARSYRRP